MIVRGKALCDLRSTFRNRFSRPLDWTDLAAEIDWCWLESGELISRDLDGSQFQKVVRICKNNLNDFNDLSGNRGILTAIYHRGCLSAAASLPRTKALAGCAAARLAAKVKSHANAGPKKRGGPRTDQAWQNRLWRAKIARPSLSRYALQSAVVGRREPVQRGCGPPVNCPNACPATTRPTGAIRGGQRGRLHSHNRAVGGRGESRPPGLWTPPVNYPTHVRPRQGRQGPYVLVNVAAY